MLVEKADLKPILPQENRIEFGSLTAPEHVNNTHTIADVTLHRLSACLFLVLPKDTIIPLVKGQTSTLLLPLPFLKWNLSGAMVTQTLTLLFLVTTLLIVLLWTSPP